MYLRANLNLYSNIKIYILYKNIHFKEKDKLECSIKNKSNVIDKVVMTHTLFCFYLQVKFEYKNKMAAKKST